MAEIVKEELDKKLSWIYVEINKLRLKIIDLEKLNIFYKEK